ncbi:MAG: DUF2281 domain-containing protein [Syntrophobacteraceae bacterium]
MNQQELLHEIRSLPPEAHRELADFVAFLRVRYRTSYKSDKSKKTELANEPFVGMWLDRTDMEDSGKWVRNTRKREWPGS